MAAIIAIGATPDAQDQARASAAYDEVHAMLENEGTATWGPAADVPAELVPHVAALVANNFAPDYQVSPQRYQRIVALAVAAPGQIARLTAPHYETMDDPQDYL